MLYCLHQSIDLMMEMQLSLLRILSPLDIIDNNNIGHSFGMRGLHLNDYDAGIKRIGSIINSGYAKQKLEELHSNISSF